MEPINLTGNLGEKFKRKFPMPGTGRERAVFLILAGLATLIAAGFDPARDGWALHTGQSAPGMLAATGPANGLVSTRLIGQYVFTDDQGVRRLAPSRRTRKFIDDVPAELVAVWPVGRPELAHAIGEYWHQLWVMLGGLVAVAGGLVWWARAPRPGQG
ncbi:MAG: hypothetical protein MUF14_08015 [Hyphomonadaceae bacterium]|jgi:hypothetical protein|nr:hypothetical protein [Hyphomonadaceae bacterium]